jgi:uncharacterized protein YecT (DUF1311 family)
MRTAIALIFTITWFGVAHAQTPDCQNAANQAAMNSCANQAYKKSDAELNAAYRDVTKRLRKDRNATRRLVAAQRTWISYRDAECAFSSFRSASGTVYPMVIASCLDRLTRARTEALQSYLKCGEGDLSCPVPAK